VRSRNEIRKIVMVSDSDEDKHYASQASKDEEGTGNSARRRQNVGIFSGRGGVKPPIHRVRHWSYVT
jgi:hypothetical protein